MLPPNSLGQKRYSQNNNPTGSNSMI